MKLNDKILKGLNIGVKQSVGIMGVYPLIGEDLEVEMAKFEDIDFIGNENYGQLIFKNNSDKPFILPTCHSIMTKQKAQDHSTTFATVLDNNNVTYIENACCIEQRQGGEINGRQCKKDNETFSFLPLEIRRDVMFYNDDSIHTNMLLSRLWRNITDFQKELVHRSEGHLIYFFTKYLDQLSKFNAEFELVEKQRGAIITFNNEIVGIEIAPTHDYFKNIWQPLLRDCYGSAMIKMAETNIKDAFLNSNKLDFSNCTDITGIKKIVNDDYLHDQSSMLLKIMQISELEFQDKCDKENTFIKTNSKFFDYHLMLDTKKEYGTEFFVDNDNIIYLSMIKK